MTPLDIYLKDYYLAEPEFAAAAGIDVQALQALVAEKRIPAPSYIVSEDGYVHSSAFGQMAAPSAKPGRYFHAKAVHWVALARSLGTSNAMKDQFQAGYRQALAELNGSVWRLPDSFADDGTVIENGLSRRLEESWCSFIDGTYSVCVSDPATATAIARKEVLQEALTVLTGNGVNPCPQGIEQAELERLIKAYATSAMPFSPQERNRSSRKRLVDDLLDKLRKVTVQAPR